MSDGIESDELLMLLTMKDEEGRRWKLAGLVSTAALAEDDSEVSRNVKEELETGKLRLCDLEIVIP